MKCAARTDCRRPGHAGVIGLDVLPEHGSFMVNFGGRIFP